MGVRRCSAGSNDAPFLWDMFLSWCVAGPLPEDKNLLSLAIQASVSWTRSSICLSAGGHLFMLTGGIFLDPTS